MRVEILQPFTCSRDGGSVDLKAGQEAFITGDNLIRALEAGGYIRILERNEPVEILPPPANYMAVKPDLAEPAGVTDEDTSSLYVKHIGRGRFAIHKGNERVSEPMTKEAAEAALAGMQ